MFSTGRRMLIPAATLLLGAGTAATSVGAGQAGSSSGPVRCEIQATTSGGMVTLQGVVRADKAVSGSYTFRVESAGGSGSSDISQGGDFSARAGDPTTLGQVMLGGNGSIYDARLEVTAGGKTYRCDGRAGGAT